MGNKIDFKENIRDEIDGITVEYYNEDKLNYWFNVRASNTEPLLRITVEAKDKQTAEKYQKELLDLINN